MSKISRAEANTVVEEFLADLQKKGWLLSVNYTTETFRLAPHPQKSTPSPKD